MKILLPLVAPGPRRDVDLRVHPGLERVHLRLHPALRPAEADADGLARELPRHEPRHRLGRPDGGRDADRDPGRDLLPHRPAPDRVRAHRGGGARMSRARSGSRPACILPELPRARGARLDPPPARGRARRDLPLRLQRRATASSSRALTARCATARPDLLIGIDEEGGDVTRLEADRGSSYPGQRGARRRRRRRADRARRGRDRRRPRRGRRQPRLRAGRRRERQPGEPGDRHPLVRRRPRARRAATSRRSSAACRRRASPPARSTSPATARPSRTRTSSCPTVDRRRPRRASSRSARRSRPACSRS